ncbi:Transposable element tcb2 transposase, partial [Caligus rogercresseyi]
FHHSLHTGPNALTDLDTYAASKDMATDVEQKEEQAECKVPMVFRTKNPAAVMVLGVISSEGHPKQKVNQEVYLDVLSNVVKTWIDIVASGRKYTFQQDSAPAHKAKTVQVWLKEN